MGYISGRNCSSEQSAEWRHRGRASPTSGPVEGKLRLLDQGVKLILAHRSHTTTTAN